MPTNTGPPTVTEQPTTRSQTTAVPDGTTRTDDGSTTATGDPGLAVSTAALPVVALLVGTRFPPDA